MQQDKTRQMDWERSNHKQHPKAEIEHRVSTRCTVDERMHNGHRINIWYSINTTHAF